MLEQLDGTCSVILQGPLKELFLLCGLNTFSGAFFDRCVVMNIYSIAKHEK